jgi:hypothetical protein
MRTYTRSTDPNARWGNTSSTLDDVKDLNEFHQHIERLGFRSYEELISRLGSVRLYVRHPQLGKRALAYQFCCLITVGGVGLPVFARDLPDIIALLVEIGAQTRTLPVTLSEGEEMQEALQGVLNRLDALPDVSRAQMQELKAPLQQIVALLKDLATSLLVGQPAATRNNRRTPGSSFK